MRYKITLDLQEKDMMETGLVVAIHKLQIGTNEDAKIILPKYKALLKKLEETPEYHLDGETLESLF